MGATDRRHAGGQQQIVTVAGHDHHRAGPKILATVGQGASPQRDMGDTALQLAFVEDLRADHVHDVLHARCDQVALPGDATQQLEGLRPASGTLGLQIGRVTLVGDILGATEIEADMARGIHRRVQQVDDAADHPFVADAAVGLGHHFHQFGNLARVVAAGSGDDDDPGIQALRHLGIEMGTVRSFLGIHQAFDHHHAGFLGRALVAGDDLLQQDVFPIVAEQVFRFGGRHRFRRVQAGDGAGQPGRAFRSGVGGVRLADGFAETDRNALAIERMHQAQGDGGQPDAWFGGDDKNCDGHDHSLVGVAMLRCSIAWIGLVVSIWRGLKKTGSKRGRARIHAPQGAGVSGFFGPAEWPVRAVPGRFRPDRAAVRRDRRAGRAVAPPVACVPDHE